MAGVAHTAPSRVESIVPVLWIGAGAGFVAGIVMLGWQSTVGGLAAEPTAVPGIASTVVSVPNAAISFFFGPDNFAGGYSFETYPGIVVHLIVATSFGLSGALALLTLAGPRPSRLAGAAIGLLYGLGLQLLVLNLFVNQVQDVNTVYTAIPEWSWWVAHLIYGTLLGLLASRWMRRMAPATAELERRRDASLA